MDGPTALVARRANVLDLLAEGPIHKRDMPFYLDVSRSTVDRAVRRLEEAGLAERSDGGYVATPAGRLALDRYRTLRREVEAVVAEGEALEPLAVDHDLPASLIDRGTVDLVDGPTPYRSVECVHEAVADAARCRMYLPQVTDAQLPGCLRRRAVEGDGSVEVVVTPAVYDHLRPDLPDSSDRGTTVLVGDGPEYALLLTTTGECDGADRERGRDSDAPDGAPTDGVTVTVVVFDERGRPHAVIRSDADRPVEWARRRYERIRSASRPPDEA